MYNTTNLYRRKYLDPILNKKGNKVKAVLELKSNCPFPELCKITDEIESSSNIIFKYLHGNPLPNSYENLGKLSSSDWIPSSNNLLSEINWAIATIRKYSQKVKLFLEYKKFYENEFILGNYDKAKVYLGKIENEVCYSIWTLEKRFLLLEFSESSKAQKTFLSEINKTAQGFFIPSLAYHISNKSEVNFSIPKYNSDIANILKDLKTNIAEANRQYYYFHLNIYDCFYTNFNDIIAFESFNSVIDRYQTLVKILKIICCNINIPEIVQQECISRIHYLNKKFDDSELRNILLLKEPSLISDFTDYSFELNILDLYTSGLYKETIERLKYSLVNNPSRFEYYLLYAKSLLFEKRSYEAPNDKKNIQNLILKDIYDFMSKEIDSQIPLFNLSRFSKNLSSFYLADGIFSFLNKNMYYKNYWFKYNKISVSHNNPIFSDSYLMKENELIYLHLLLSNHPDSISVKYKLTKEKEDINSALQNLNIPETIKLVELAKSHQAKSEFTSAIILWNSLLESSKSIIPIYETSIKNLIISYSELGELNNAISIYVNSYLENPYLVQSINCEQLHSKIRVNKFKNVYGNIDLPLFYSLSCEDENEIHIAYEKFNQSIGVERPSEILTNYISIDRRKLILYLSITCNTDIFKHSLFINGYKDGINERIEICKFLITIDQENETTYRKELNSLTDTLIIQEGLQQLDEGKIYVNEQGLINLELKEYEGLYTRFQTIASILNDKSKDLVFFAKEGILAVVDSEDEIGKKENKSKISSHPLKEFFKEAFEVITLKFLNSKFGIAAYLSTRIRHGVLLGEIRPIFEKFHLIAQKDHNSKSYRDVEHWNMRYNYLSKHDINILQNEIGMLSEQIDNLILNLIKNNLQIKTEKENPEGWFDYSFDDNTLILYSIRLSFTKNYQEFIKNIIQILWERTDQNLEIIRSRIQGEVKDKFNDAITKFGSNLRLKFNNYVIPDVFTNINTCSTEVQNAIDRIASWFNRSGRITLDFKLDKLINIVLQNINHSYQTKQIALFENILYNPTIKGEYYSHFADLFRIFFDNALKHSIPHMQEISVTVDVKSLNNSLSIEITNNYPNEVNLGAIPYKGVLKNIETGKLSTEGKSGFHKALKIMQSDLKNEQNECSLFKKENGDFCALLQINIENLIV